LTDARVWLQWRLPAHFFKQCKNIISKLNLNFLNSTSDFSFFDRSQSWNGGISFLFSYIKHIITRSYCFHFLRFILLQTWTISEIEALEKVDRKKRLILAMVNSINCEGNNSGLILPWPLISGFCLVKEKEKVLRYHTLGQNHFQKIILISFLTGFTNDKHIFHRKQKCKKWDTPSEMFSDRCAHHIQFKTFTEN
jgi:hypothetical protein